MDWMKQLPKAGAQPRAAYLCNKHIHTSLTAKWTVLNRMRRSVVPSLLMHTLDCIVAYVYMCAICLSFCRTFLRAGSRWGWAGEGGFECMHRTNGWFQLLVSDVTVHSTERLIFSCLIIPEGNGGVHEMGYRDHEFTCLSLLLISWLKRHVSYVTPEGAKLFPTDTSDRMSQCCS